MDKQFLLLWDIDGTIISTGHAGEEAMNRAGRRAFGRDASLAGVDYRGRTDVWIAREMLKQLGLPPTAANTGRFIEAYLAGLEELLPLTAGTLLPGIAEMLRTAAVRGDCVNALLTGNLARGAELKLAHYAVWHYFGFGAFANDSHLRNDLGPVALRRAREKTGREFAPADVFVIGDTPHDIACGNIIGAKTIAVAPGGYAREELLAHRPTACFDDFRHPEQFFALLGR